MKNAEVAILVILAMLVIMMVINRNAANADQNNKQSGDSGHRYSEQSGDNEQDDSADVGDGKSSNDVINQLNAELEAAMKNGGSNKNITAANDQLNPPNVYPENPACLYGYYSPLYNTVLNDRHAGCFGAATQPTGSISEGTLPLFYNHEINSMSEISPSARNQQWYGPHSGYLN